MPQPDDTRPEGSDAAEARREVIDALQEGQRPMTETELAGITGQDVETVRETLSELADEAVVEVTYESDQPTDEFPEEPDTPPDEMTGRLTKP